MNSCNEEIKKLKKMMKSLLDNKPILCKTMIRQDLPDFRGVYCFFNKKDEPVYIGSCGVKGKLKKGTLRLRVWGDHMIGDFKASSLKRKLQKIIKKINSKEDAKEFIKDNFYVQYKRIPNNLKKITLLEHFMIAVYNPIYND